MPITVGIGDTIERKPAHICDPNLTRADQEVQGRVGEAQGKHSGRGKSGVRAKIHCPDIYCGRYDLNLTKEHFKELLTNTTARSE